MKKEKAMITQRIARGIGGRIGMLAIGAALLAMPFTIPLMARAQVLIGPTIAPPAPRYEPVPPPRRGYVWDAGHWQWVGGRYNWYAGRWMPARPGYHWAPGGWNHQGPNWVYAPGQWVR